MSSLNHILLVKVFEKAMDMSLNSLGESDLTECCGPMREIFGNALQKLFVNNMVVKTQSNATVIKQLIFLSILTYFTLISIN